MSTVSVTTQEQPLSEDNEEGNDENNNDHDDDDESSLLLRPFEWLTSPSSLKPYILNALQYCRNNNNDATITTNNNDKNFLSVLHVGCGSSILGELLLEDNEYNIHYVLNIDNDEKTLQRMKKRWEKKKYHNNNNNNDSSMMNKILEFQTIELCNKHSSININNNQSNQFFDLIIDKGTLDCLLCQNIECVSALVTETYRLMKKSNNNNNNNNSVYMIVSLNSKQLLHSLLTNIPGCDWDVHIYTMKRHTENLQDLHDDNNNNNNNSYLNTTDNNHNSCIINDNEDLNNDRNKPITCTNNHWFEAIEPLKLSPSLHDSYGVDENDTHTKYTTVNIVYCCCRCTYHDDDKNIDDTNPSTTTFTNQLNFDHVYEHIRSVMDEWFQTKNPYVTTEKVQEIYDLFGNHNNNNNNNNNENSKSLHDAYLILFNDIERANYYYEEDYIPDWIAFCDTYNNSHRNIIKTEDDITTKTTTKIPTDSMTAEIAIEFLKAVQ